jgi:hypothetical protein
MQAVIATCTDCHAGSSSKNVPRLTTVADFEAQSTLGGTVGERSIARMKNAQSPMPPGNLPPSSEVTAFATWVRDGYPLDCPSTTTSGTVVTGSGAGGAGGAGGATNVTSQ